MNAVMFVELTDLEGCFPVVVRDVYVLHTFATRSLLCGGLVHCYSVLYVTVSASPATVTPFVAFVYVAFAWTVGRHSISVFRLFCACGTRLPFPLPWYGVAGQTGRLLHFHLVSFLHFYFCIFGFGLVACCCGAGTLHVSLLGKRHHLCSSKTSISAFFFLHLSSALLFCSQGISFSHKTGELKLLLLSPPLKTSISFSLFCCRL